MLLWILLLVEISSLFRLYMYVKIQSKRLYSVVACQRYVCPNVISMTMNVVIQECIIENCFIEPYV